MLRCERDGSGTDELNSILPAAADSSNLAAVLKRFLRGGEHAYHAQARLAIGQWSPTGANRIEKLSDYITQGFGRIQLGRPNVAGAITHQSLIISFAIGADAVRSYTFVIDAHFLGWLNVIVQNHLATTGD